MKAFLLTAGDDGINLLFNKFKFNTWEDISPAIGCRTFDVVRLYENGDCAYIGTDEMGETVDFKTPLEVLKESIKPVSKSELYIYSRANPDDYRPFFFTEEELGMGPVDCEVECDYAAVRAGECECFNRKHDEMEANAPC